MITNQPTKYWSADELKAMARTVIEQRKAFKREGHPVIEDELNHLESYARVIAILNCIGDTDNIVKLFMDCCAKGNCKTTNKSDASGLLKVFEKMKMEYTVLVLKRTVSIRCHTVTERLEYLKEFE